MISVKQTLLQLSLVVALALAAFLNVLDNAFVYDDHLQILDNPWLRDPRHLIDIFTHEVWGFTDYSASDYYRPLMHSLNLLVYTWFGPDRIAFHAASLLLHLGCCVLFYLTCRELVAKAPQATAKIEDRLPLLAAMLFAVYPANTEAVAWLGSSADLLYVFFCLAAWWCWMRSEPRGEPRRLVLFCSSLGLFMAATLSKETAFLFPLLLVVVDGVQGRFSGGGFWDRLQYNYLPFACVAALSLVLRFSVLGGVKPVTHSMTVNLPGLLWAFAWYLAHLFWPFSHNFYTELPTASETGLLSVIIFPLLVLIVSAILVVLFCRVRLLWIALALMVLPLLPALMNSVLGMPVAERYLYLPGMGFCLFLAWTAERFLSNQRLRYIVLALVLMGFAGASFARNTQFHNDLTIWEDTIQKSPRSVKALSWYATALLARGRIEEGITYTHKAIELGLKSGNSLYDLARALEKIGRAPETALFFNRVLSLHPGDADAYFEVGRTYYLLGENESAITTLERSLELRGDNSLALIVLGRALVARGEAPRALAMFERAIQLDANAYPSLKEEMTRLSALGLEK